jgi:hypothetical protein
MPAPILAVVAAAAVGAGTSVATGYALEMTIGDKHYSRRDFAIDATLGAVGVGTAKNIGKAGYHGAKYAVRLRRAEKAGDTARTVRRSDGLVGRSRYAKDLEQFDRAKADYGYHTGVRAYAERFRDGEPRTYYDPIDFDGENRGLNQIYESIMDEIMSRANRRLSRPSKSQRRGITPCRCKDGSYSVKCC